QSGSWAPPRDPPPPGAAAEQQVSAHDLQGLLCDRQAEPESVAVASGRTAETWAELVELRPPPIAGLHAELDELGGHSLRVDGEAALHAVLSGICDHV